MQSEIGIRFMRYRLVEVGEGRRGVSLDME